MCLKLLVADAPASVFYMAKRARAFLIPLTETAKGAIIHLYSNPCTLHTFSPNGDTHVQARYRHRPLLSHLRYRRNYRPYQRLRRLVAIHRPLRQVHALDSTLLSTLHFTFFPTSVHTPKPSMRAFILLSLRRHGHWDSSYAHDILPICDKTLSFLVSECWWRC